MSAGTDYRMDLGQYSQNVTTSTTTKSKVASNFTTKTELTNVETKSDAWGKVLPISFGRCRVGGQLIWATPFYKTTQNFDVTEETNVADTTTTINHPLDPDVAAYQFHKPVSNDAFPAAEGPIEYPSQIVRSSSQLSHTELTQTSIDLLYSFGKEGDIRKQRYIDKIRINDQLVYDDATGYAANDLKFTTRYGYSGDIPETMKVFEDALYHYKGQTLLLFTNFPTQAFGDKIPDSIDVEFGCCCPDEGGGGGTGGNGGSRNQYFGGGGSNLGYEDMVGYFYGDAPVPPVGSFCRMLIMDKGGYGYSVGPGWKPEGSGGGAGGATFTFFSCELTEDMIVNHPTVEGRKGVKLMNKIKDPPTIPVQDNSSTPYIIWRASIWEKFPGEDMDEVFRFSGWGAIGGGQGSINDAPAMEEKTRCQAEINCYTNICYEGDVDPGTCYMSDASPEKSPMHGIGGDGNERTGVYRTLYLFRDQNNVQLDNPFDGMTFQGQNFGFWFLDVPTGA